MIFTIIHQYEWRSMAHFICTSFQTSDRLCVCAKTIIRWKWIFLQEFIQIFLNTVYSNRFSKWSKALPEIFSDLYTWMQLQNENFHLNVKRLGALFIWNETMKSPNLKRKIAMKKCISRETERAREKFNNFTRGFWFYILYLSRCFLFCFIVCLVKNMEHQTVPQYVHFLYDGYYTLRFLVVTIFHYTFFFLSQ